MRGQQFDKPLPVSPDGYWKGGKYFERDSLFPEQGITHLQPHQMSPEEFADHPYAVVHGSHVDPQRVQGSSPWAHDDLKAIPQKRFINPDERSLSPEAGSAVHMGTQQAAYERGHVTSDHSGAPQYHHVFWYVPGAKDIHWSQDDEANETHDYVGPKVETEWDSEDVLHEDANNPKNWRRKTYSEYYHNSVEDEGSTSLAVRNFNRLASQRDFVEAAIKRGKAHEVHPETMRRYREGTLGFERHSIPDVEDLQSRQLKKYLDVAKQPDLWGHEADPQYINRLQEHWQPQTTWDASKLSEHQLSQIEDEFDVPLTFKRGLNHARVRNRLALDRQEGGGYAGMFSRLLGRSVGEHADFRQQLDFDDQWYTRPSIEDTREQ